VAALISAGLLRTGPIGDDLLALYEVGFAVAALGTAAIIGELRTSESAGRLRARELSRRTIAGEDEVRRRVADFIHDGPVQELIGLEFILEGARVAAERGDARRAADLLAEARGLTAKNVRALRDEIVSLGPYAFGEVSFESACEQCLPIWKRRWGCDVEVEAERLELAPEVANDLFRITQEAVANSCKHGETTDVKVILREVDGFVELRIRDYGNGLGELDPWDPAQPGHIGLASMRERAELLLGHLEIEGLDDGVEVRVRVPRGGGTRRRKR
jgi:signal transduction histidine kinase